MIDQKRREAIIKSNLEHQSRIDAAELIFRSTLTDAIDMAMNCYVQPRDLLSCIHEYGVMKVHDNAIEDCHEKFPNE